MLKYIKRAYVMSVASYMGADPDVASYKEVPDAEVDRATNEELYQSIMKNNSFGEEDTAELKELHDRIDEGKLDARNIIVQNINVSLKSALKYGHNFSVDNNYRELHTFFNILKKTGTISGKVNLTKLQSEISSKLEGGIQDTTEFAIIEDVNDKNSLIITYGSDVAAFSSDSSYDPILTLNKKTGVITTVKSNYAEIDTSNIGKVDISNERLKEDMAQEAGLSVNAYDAALDFYKENPDHITMIDGKSTKITASLIRSIVEFQKIAKLKKIDGQNGREVSDKMQSLVRQNLISYDTTIYEAGQYLLGVSKTNNKKIIGDIEVHNATIRNIASHIFKAAYPGKGITEENIKPFIKMAEETLKMKIKKVPSSVSTSKTVASSGKESVSVSGTSHTVVSGDTLGKLVRKYYKGKLSIKEGIAKIKTANPQIKGTTIILGKKYKIPKVS